MCDVYISACLFLLILALEIPDTFYVLSCTIVDLSQNKTVVSQIFLEEILSLEIYVVFAVIFVVLASY